VEYGFFSLALLVVSVGHNGLCHHLLMLSAIQRYSNNATAVNDRAGRVQCSAGGMLVLTRCLWLLRLRIVCWRVRSRKIQCRWSGMLVLVRCLRVRSSRIGRWRKEQINSMPLEFADEMLWKKRANGRLPGSIQPLW